MKLFDKRLAKLEADVNSETGCKVALVANDEDKEVSLQKVRDLHASSNSKHDNLITVLIHPGAMPSTQKYEYFSG